MQSPYLNISQITCPLQQKAVRLTCQWEILLYYLISPVRQIHLMENSSHHLLIQV